MNSTAIAIAVSLVIGGTAGAGATAIAFSFTATVSPATAVAAVIPACPPVKEAVTQPFLTRPVKPLPTTGYATYGAKDFP